MDEKELNEAIEALCRSKAEEFRMIGYEHVTAEEIWQCVSSGYRSGTAPPLHKIVNDILTLKVTSFMNYMTISAFKGTAFQ
ncbi:post-transcriptional regulator [Paenibacillus sp. 1P07SE]|uniref:post-transcriptional regulator n=1 Tax=Paenibacillus sp. 1P07SE TaxID=3132209 RepID=UPI0039A40259